MGQHLSSDDRRTFVQKSLLAWEDSIEESMELSKFTDLVEFLRKRMITLEAVHGLADVSHQPK